jgi:hypothetical protein
VLQVGVHHADPRRAGDAHAVNDGAAEPAPADVRLTVDEADRAVRPLRERADHRVGPILGVVDEDDLDRMLGHDRGETGHERLDIAGLVARRHHDRHDGTDHVV